jgi:hypothetical protein
MLEVARSHGQSALQSAFVRIRAFPDPRTPAGAFEDPGLSCHHDAYGDNPYVDCPYADDVYDDSDDD